MSFLNYQDPRPVYEQITDYFKKLILTGALEKGSQMPSVRQMAAELSINPNTIQKAYAILEGEGFIYSVKGKGNFVAGNETLLESKRREWMSRMEEFLKEGREIGVNRDQIDKITEKVFGGGK